MTQHLTDDQVEMMAKRLAGLPGLVLGVVAGVVVLLALLFVWLIWSM